MLGGRHGALAPLVGDRESERKPFRAISVWVSNGQLADTIRERANRLFAKADADREQGKIKHALKLANLASHIMNEAAAADAAAIATQEGTRKPGAAGLIVSGRAWL